MNNACGLLFCADKSLLARLLFVPFALFCDEEEGPWPSDLL